MRSLVKLLLIRLVRYRPPVEVVVICLLLSTVLAITVPGILEIRERARQNAAKHQLKDLGLKLQTHHSTFGSFPATPTTDAKPSPAAKPQTELISPLVALPSGIR